MKVYQHAFFARRAIMATGGARQHVRPIASGGIDAAG
jgi:hypothetical protein